ncbi:unnamed protein product [Macrosiphum euphorbiae]|uniref:Reverse transcriptase domain-containing protein n=1 Tax=Macrosiphum euphorbiae TaxID=13131 RepID=A0AAV0VK51_9HEMI|nr:unnamed protein product [Macrosiphum euphorbiae]
MTEISNIQLGNTANIVLYADDIALTVAAARPHTAHSRIESYLDSLKTWAKAYEVEFSPTKSQLLSLKGGLKPGYSIDFDSGDNDARIVAEATAKYLGVILDPRESFWDHVSSLKTKSEGMYRRLRQMTSANWGMGRALAKVVYEAVFLPHITYAAEIWAEGGCALKKSIAALGSMQREPLRAITSSYKTVSTNCLSVVEGVLPLDLEVRRVKQKCTLRAGEKLFSFKLQPNPNCACGNGAEKVRHVLLSCTRTLGFREELIATMAEDGVAWQPESEAFLSTRKTYEALKRFSKNSL